MLLTHRKLLQSKAIAIENDLRGTLRNFGLKVGMVGKVKFEARIRELVENLPDLAVLVEPMLIVRRTLREQIVILHRRLLAIVRDDEVCRRLMTTPGVGPVVALTYRATVDVPARFRKSKAVGAVFGLTCAKYQSGEVDRNGRIAGRPKLVGFDAHLFDDRPPFVQLRFEKRGQLGWCRASSNRANLRKSLLRLRMGNRSDSIDVYLSDDVSRGFGRQEKCVPGRYVKSGYAGLGNTWNVWQEGRSHGGGYGQRADRATIN